VQRTELPDLGEGPHFFYGLQWWFFGVLAVFGFGYLAWDERRQKRRSREAGHARQEPVRRT
jgi:cytochrome oxidase assembly protein ShyY1